MDCIGTHIARAEIEHLQFGESDYSLNRQIKNFVMI